MQLEVFSDPHCFMSLHDEWQELMARSKTAPLFSTPEFAASWWSVFGRGDLKVVTVRDQGKLLGVAPLFYCDGILSLLGNHEVSDYLDIIVDRDHSSAVLTEIWQFLAQKIEWQTLNLLSLPNTSPLLPFLEQSGVALEKKQQDVCPVLELPASWEEYLSAIGKKQRHEIKRKWKNLEQQVHPEFVVVEAADQLAVFLPEFIRLHQLSSQEKAAFWTEDQISYFQKCCTAAAQNGWLKLFFMKVEGKLVATMLGFAYHDQFLLYNSGYDPVQFAGLSVGIVLTAYTIQQAIVASLKIYDFLRGDEEYKFRFRAVAQPVWDVKVNNA